MEFGALHQSFLPTECEADRTQGWYRDHRIAGYRVGRGNHLRLWTGILGQILQEQRLPLRGMPAKSCPSPIAYANRATAVSANTLCPIKACQSRIGLWHCHCGIPIVGSSLAATEADSARSSVLLKRTSTHDSGAFAKCPMADRSPRFRFCNGSRWHVELLTAYAGRHRDAV
jgi:hypothetical protein